MFISYTSTGTKTISTSTSDLQSITFYLPLKYTKRPSDISNGTTASKRPPAAGLQRSKTHLSALDEIDGAKISKQAVRFIPYVGVIKKDTTTKPVVETRWQNDPHKMNGTTSKSIPVQEELSRAKTFHDFEKEFDKKHKFPVDIKQVPKLDNKTTETLSIGNVTNTSTASSSLSRNCIVRVRSQEELDRISHDTPGDEKNKPDNGELDNGKSSNSRKLYFKRSRTIPGINYTSPYAMTKEQKGYLAQRKAWVTLQHNHEQAKQKWLKEVKKKENESAFTNWIRYKTVMAGKMRESLKRTQSEPSKTLDPSVPK